jgi:hypothetical protein
MDTSSYSNTHEMDAAMLYEVRCPSRVPPHIMEDAENETRWIRQGHGLWLPSQRRG